MIAPASIPAGFLRRARGHLRRTGQPLLLRPRRPTTDHPILALPGDAGRYLIMLEPDETMGHLAGLVATGDTVEERTVSMVEKLMGFTLTAIAGLPNNFECDGEKLGRFYVIADTLCLEGGPLALAALSWVLYHRKAGLFLRLSEADTG